MNLLFDLGNTRLKCALVRDRIGDGHRLEDQAIEHPAAFVWNGPDFEPRLRQWLSDTGADATTPIWLAAVAPDAAIARVAAVIESLGLRAPTYVRAQADALGVRVAYAQPETLGVDRWLGLLAARARGHEATLVVSVGSALTIDAVDANGRHLGGLIAPPPDAMRAALIARAPRLDVPHGSIERFAASTSDAIASGCVLAAAALIERSHAELARRGASAPALLLTGGGAEVLRGWIPPHELVPSLVLDGLACWVAQAQK